MYHMTIYTWMQVVKIKTCVLVYKDRVRCWGKSLPWNVKMDFFYNITIDKTTSQLFGISLRTEFTKKRCWCCPQSKKLMKDGESSDQISGQHDDQHGCVIMVLGVCSLDHFLDRISSLVDRFSSLLWNGWVRLGGT